MTSEVTPLRTPAETGLDEAFADLHRKLPGGVVTARREAAFRCFAAKGLPHRRVEEWKYTDLRTLMRDAKPLAVVPGAAAKARAAHEAGVMFAATAPRRILFVDGTFAPEHSDLGALEPGLAIGSLAQALGCGDDMVTRLGFAGSAADEDVAYSLNTAFMADGAIIELAPGTRIARPLHLIFAYASPSPAAVFSRSSVVLGDDAALTLIESHEGAGGVDYQTNAALDVVIGKRARLDHVKVNAEGKDALHLSTMNAAVGPGAEFYDLTFILGGKVVRNQLFVRCTGEGAQIGLNGVSLLRGNQHADTSLLLDHAVGHCRSHELFKSVLDDASRGVFQGKIIVRPGAQKTDARMMTRALLLSEDAEADNKPELEIFADDVQCGHGATSGALDDHLKFYLMARGIPEKQAEALLIESFVGEVVETVAREGIRDALMAATRQWLGARR